MNYLSLFITILGLVSKYGLPLMESIAKQWQTEGKNVTLEDIEGLKTSDEMAKMKAILDEKASVVSGTTETTE